ncbi:unnamed protein product [Caenorhabditis bovis]|uniref:Receptor L-domain domain-containing protein n=1 Tax=Caenorhabditis bovis TaxID=2654633 RepID=A0A8S1EBY7_9PELO|nr:unnamed protein product [Caenorhabditis bovis]
MVRGVNIQGSTDISMRELRDFFQTNEIIDNPIIVNDSDFEDLSFLKLYRVQNGKSKTDNPANVEIKNNLKLTNLGFSPKIDGINIEIVNNPNICISPQDLVKMTDTEQNSDKIFDVKLCENSESPESYCIIPKSGLLKDFPNYCVYLFGDLVIDENFDFANSYKLNSVIAIYGTLRIENSKIRTANFLPNLNRIYAIQQKRPPMEIIDNPYLYLMFDNHLIREIYSTLPIYITNNPRLRISSFSCMTMMTWKMANVSNNLLNCNETTDILKVPFDSTPLNSDVYFGIPRYYTMANSPADHQSDPGSQIVPNENEPAETSGESEPNEKCQSDSFANPEHEYSHSIYINSSTKHLPEIFDTIDTVKGVIMEGPSDITVHELKVFFEKIIFFQDSIIVNNTNYDDLSFLNPYLIESVKNKFTIIIMNNPNLKRIGMPIKNCRFCYGWIRIEDNPLLD